MVEKMPSDTLLPKRFDWANALVITLTPPLALASLGFYVHAEGMRWPEVTAFLVMYALTGTAITAGYHRYYSHRTYDCSRGLQWLILLFGAAALQNSALSWASDHRDHHRHTDRSGDPYNIRKGFFWAHVGWIYYKYSVAREFPNARDLKKDRLVMWQHRYAGPVGCAVGFGLPFLFGLAFDRAWGCLIWGGLLRLVVVHHATFLINSAAHTFGHKPHSEGTSARDSWWLPFVSFGEGYHNYHHTYPGDYRNGAAWYHWDTTKWMIRGMSLFGWTWNLRRSLTARPLRTG